MNQIFCFFYILLYKPWLSSDFAFMDSNALPLLLSCSWLNCHTGQGDSNQQACRKNIASLAADSPTKKEALQHTTWELGRSTKAMGVESTGIEISCNPGLPEKTTQAVLDSFRDILVSVCIIIHNPPSCYMLHHCATDPHALNLTVQHQFLCAFLPMHSWNVHAIVRRTCRPPACGQPGWGSVVDLSCWAVCGRLG